MKIGDLVCYNPSTFNHQAVDNMKDVFLLLRLPLRRSALDIAIILDGDRTRPIYLHWLKKFENIE